MKVKYAGTHRYTSLKEFFSIYWNENDESDYVFEITLLGRNWVWYINK
jgi:hypothetical protein